MTKPKLLLLVHRIPYPPNKGDKIRSFNLLRHLALEYQVYLGAFIDDPNDWQYEAKVRGYCTDAYFRKLDPLRARFRSLDGFLNKEPLSKPYYFDYSMHQWVQRQLREQQIDRILVFSSAMGQYVSGPAFKSLRRVMDFVDVDSDKWAQYARRKRWPMSWVYERESQQLARLERQIAAEFDASFFVSDAEANLFRRLAPESQSKICSFDNGVDSQYFDPALSYPNPYDAGAPVIVFTGAMDYFANIDSVSWFVNEVMPILRQRKLEFRFYIVGSNPTEAVQKLGQQPGVTVTGRVPDVRPYISHALCAVAPLRIARGVQNKVLEAFSLGKVTLCTPAAAEGLISALWLKELVEADPTAFARKIERILQGDHSLLEFPLRSYVLQHYSWFAHLTKVSRVLAGEAPETLKSLPAFEAISG